MNPASPTPRTKRPPAALLVAGLLTGASMLTACGASTNTASTTSTTSTTPAQASGSAPGATAGTNPNRGGPVLPVAGNPITNTSTAQMLKIDSVLVENNVDTAGKATSDHLEIALANTGATDLSGVEVFYTFTDPATNVTENYYAKLPGEFTIPANGTRAAHFDHTSTTDHFPVSDFSLYYTDANALEVTVVVSATGAAVQTTTIQKDAGGPETAD